MNRITTVLVVLVVALVAGWESFCVIDETELAIVTQFGKYRYSLYGPGIYRKWPFVQKVHRMESRILGSDAPPSELLTLDKKRIVADPITRYRIVDPLRFYMTVNNESGVKARLDDIVNSELRREIADRNFGDIVGNERDPMMQEVASRVRRLVVEFGIGVVDVRIKRADLPPENERAVFGRMKAERERQAKKYRSEGQEEAQKLRSTADKERAIILAEAYRQAQEIKGKGEADAIRIYAQAFEKDPEFYQFIRTMDAYKASLKGGTTMVLTPDSEFLEYLNGVK